MNNYFSSLIQILPAIIGFSIAGWILLYFLYEKNPKGILWASFSFLISGFFVEILAKNIKKIQEISDYNIPIVGSLIAIYLANLLLKQYDKEQKKGEISILFLNAIESNLRYLKNLRVYISDDNSSFKKSRENIKYIEIYRENLQGEKYYSKAFNEIGIYDKITIDLIYKYSIRYEECLTAIDKFLKELHDYKKGYYEIIFPFTKVSVVITLLFGILCVYLLEVKYKKEDMNDANKKFLTEYTATVDILKKYFDFTRFFKYNKKLAFDFIEQLKYIRKKYKEINSDLFPLLDSVEKEPIYISQILPNQPITSDAEKLYISIDEVIVAFGNSQEDAEKNCENSFKSLLKDNEDKFRNSIQDCERKTDIISPWN